MTRLMIVKAESLKEKKAILSLLNKYNIISYDVYKIGKTYKFEILLNRELSAILQEELQNMGFGKSFRRGIVIQDVIVSVPSVKKKQILPTISDEEIKEDIRENATFNWVYISFLVLASLVVALGLLSNDLVVVIGGMLIAPVLYPIIGSSYYLIALKEDKAKKHFYTEIYSVLIPILIGLILGLSYEGQISREIIWRGHFDLYDVGVALFAGAAGALSLITRKLSGFSGVAIAVALLPPAVLAGIAMGISNHSLFLSALAVTFANIFFIHLSSVILLRVLGYPHK